MLRRKGPFSIQRADTGQEVARCDYWREVHNSAVYSALAHKHPVRVLDAKGRRVAHADPCPQ